MIRAQEEFIMSLDVLLCITEKLQVWLHQMKFNFENWTLEFLPKGQKLSSFAKKKRNPMNYKGSFHIHTSATIDWNKALSM